MKRFIVWIFTSLLLLMTAYIAAFPVFASDNMRFIVEDAETYAGESFKVPIKIFGNTGFVSASILVSYDESVLSLTKINDLGLASGQVHTTKYTSPYMLTWENDTHSSNILSNGSLVELEFAVSIHAQPGEYDIHISTPKHGILDQDGNEVSCAFQDGIVTVLLGECDHIWSNWKKNNGSYHKRSCSLCNETEYERHDWDDGIITEEATEEETGIKMYTCDICNGNKYTSIPALETESPEATLTGSIKSFGVQTEPVTLTLRDLSGGVADSTVTAAGTYTLTAPAGTYTLEVSKNKHVTSTYTVTLAEGGAVQNVKIWLLGDVNGDGKINVKDATQVNRYYNNLSSIIGGQDEDAGYRKLIADVNGDGKINVKDATQIKRFYNNLSSVLST